MIRIGAALLLTAFATLPAAGAEDHRAWQHGIDLLRVGERLLMIWGSPGNPPRANPGGNWEHDIYFSWVDDWKSDSPRQTPPEVLVSRPEAQEPPSAAINARGTILVTSEDGDGGINQNAGLWDSGLQVRRPYPIMIRRGGHSGHAAALGDRFLVAYGEGWAEGGGFLGRGTSRDIHARIVEHDGRMRREIPISIGRRDGWPLVAASERNWMVVWQRYPGLTLHAALVAPGGKVSARQHITGGMPVRYAYDVAFAPQLGAYVVAGTSDGQGFVAILGTDGRMLRIRRGLPPMVSESRIVVGRDGSQLVGVYPVSPRGIAVVRLAANAIELAKTIDHAYTWDYVGTTGIFSASGRVLFATLSTAGLRLIQVNLRD